MRGINDIDYVKMADDITAKIYLITYASLAMQGYKVDIDENIVKEVTKRLLNDPIPFAEEVQDDIFKKLLALQHPVMQHNVDHVNLASSHVMLISGILKFGIAKVKLFVASTKIKPNDESPKVWEAKNILRSSLKILNAFNMLTINYDAVTMIQELKVTITQLEKKLNPAVGCFIATYVYESYDAPEVVKLRLFRDFQLSRFVLGRVFIKYYYFISPKIIKMFSNSIIFKKLVKVVLNLFVKSVTHNMYRKII